MAAAFVVGAATSPGVSTAHAAGGQKVRVCHRTGSDSNPYTLLKVSVNSAAFKGHLAHRNNPAEWKNGRRDYIEGLDGKIKVLRHCMKWTWHLPHRPDVMPIIIPPWWPRPTPGPGPGPIPFVPDIPSGTLGPGQVVPFPYPLKAARRLVKAYLRRQAKEHTAPASGCRMATTDVVARPNC